MNRVFIVAFLLLSTQLFAQDVNILMKEASNFERTLKDEQALDKYKQVLATEPTNLQALIRCSELSSAIGGRQKDKNARQGFYDQAKDYAEKALVVNAEDADANYVRAVVAGKLTEVETENKKLLADVKDIKTFADKALSINPNHGKANYVLGKWHFQMVALSWTKKAAIKVLFGGMPDATIENAIKYMEKCRSLEPYFVLNFLDLAKAYKYDNKPAKAIEVLNQLVKLPTRTPDDVGLKTEGKNLLAELQ
jgi:tetratricopeptide (TPR) repeat protein